MANHEFGGEWTTEKLERIRKYLHAYMQIFSKNPRARSYKTIYVDAFAGTGYRTQRQAIPIGHLIPELAEHDSELFLKGSAQIALEVEPAFHRYLFIERDPERAHELDALRARFPEKASRIEVLQEEANSYLKRWSGSVDWKQWRAVVFLDPYGMQVEWSLLEAIARTEAIDLWLLFPLGIGVCRLLTRGQLPPEYWAQSLTRTLGTDEWRVAFYSHRSRQTLFGEEEDTIRDADFEDVGRFFVKRLTTIFKGVAENPLLLRNSRRNPLYLLCFAAANPKGAPTAVGIAQHILRA
jgi:three-Cys-motif partner protein